MRSRSVGVDVACLQQDLEWKDVSLAVRDLIQEVFGVVAEEIVCRGLCACHVDSFDEKDVARAIEIGCNGDDSECVVCGIGLIRLIEGIFSS